MQHIRWYAAALLGLVPGLAAAGCGDDDDGPSENTGQSCNSPDDCYPNIGDRELEGGAAVCMDRVTGGYCTHFCTADTDCCAVEGECISGVPQVCSPFESTGELYCFLSCEADVVAAAGFADETGYCQANAHRSFVCRSSGGGSANRKVCVPNG